MATGTGKTLTSLAAAVNCHKTIGRLALVILVPYLHLVEQWEQNCREFGFYPIKCSGEHKNWQRSGNGKKNAIAGYGVYIVEKSKINTANIVFFSRRNDTKRAKIMLSDYQFCSFPQ